MPYDSGPQNYEPKADAHTLHEAERIKSDPKRHGHALKHLKEMADTTHAAHKAARKHLEKVTKGRMAKTFGAKQDESSAPQLNQNDLGTAEEAGEHGSDSEKGEAY